MTYTGHLTAGLAAAWDCKPDEVQQRLATKRKRTGKDALEREDIAWTAARCNRLLRTITSRISILRRHAKLPAIERGFNNSTSTFLHQQTSQKMAIGSKSRRVSCGKDPEWMPDGGAKPTSRTYGGKTKPTRTRSNQTKAKSSDGPGLSTPFVKRLMNADLTTIPSEKRRKPDEGPRRQRQLPVRASSANEEAQRNLVSAFASALDATGATAVSSRVGASSLMSACLRKIPQCVELEVSELDEDEARLEDVTSELFAELEGLGTKSGGGWAGLREAVRASCMSHVGNAIEEGLISSEKISELVGACSRRGAIREAHCVIQAWLDRHAAMSKQQLKFDHLALRELLGLQQSHSATEMYLRTLTELIQNDWISVVDCLAPDQGNLTILTKALVRGPGREVALAFLEAVLCAEARDCATSADASISSARLANVLAAVSLAHTKSNTTLPGDTTSSAIHAAAIGLFTRSHPHARILNLRSLPFILASYLLSLARSSSEQTLLSLQPTMFTAALQDRAFTEGLIESACAIATNISHLSDVSATTAIDMVTRGFVDAAKVLGSKTGGKLKALGVEIALAFAHRTGTNVHPSLFDSSLGSRSSGKLHTPRQKASSFGYKWEEGLCEWIASTPFAALAKDDQANNLPVVARFKARESQKEPGREDMKRTTRRTPSPRKLCGAPKPSLLPALSPDVLAVRSPNICVRQRANLSKPEVGKADPPTKLPTTELKEEPPVRNFKRSHSSVALGDENAPLRTEALQVVEIDELGIPTPAKKKVRSSTGSSAPKRRAQRRSLPVRALVHDVMSDDELGL